VEVEIDAETGEVTMPTAEVVIPEDADVAPEDIEIEAPDLTQPLVVDGVESAPVVDQLADQLPGFEVTQENGIVNVTDGEGVNMALMPTGDVVKDEEAKPGISVDDEGRYVLVTEVGLKFSFLPAPKDPVKLCQAAGLGKGNKVKVKKHGGVHFGVKGKGRIAAMFSPFIDKAPEGAEPGVTYDDSGMGTVVYPDGTMQNIMPAMPEPDALNAAVQALLAQLGLTVSIEFKFNVMDGTATFTGVDGQEQQVIPNFEVTPPAEETAGEAVEPSLELIDASTAEITTEDGTQTLNIVPVGGEEVVAPVEGETEAEAPTEGETEAEAPVEGETEAEAPAEGETEAEAPAEGETEAEAPAEGDAEAAPAEGDAEAAPAESDATAPAEGDAEAAPAEGDATAPAEGDTTAPAEGDATAPAEGDATVPTEGDATVPTEGDATASAEGDATAPADSDVATTTP
jgi:hypothetical protein